MTRNRGRALARAATRQIDVGASAPDSIRRRLIAGMGGLMSLRAAFSAFSFASAILLARLLGPKSLGDYSYSMAWIVLLAVPALFGMDQLLIREVAVNAATSEWAILHGLLRWSRRLVFRLSCGLAAIAGACVWALAARAHPEMRITFIAALPFLPLISLTRVRQSIMQGLHLVSRGALPEQLIQPGLLLCFLAAAAALGMHLTAPAAMLANVIAAAAAFVAGAVMLNRSLPNAILGAAPVYRSAAWGRSALPLVFVAGVGVVFGQADTLILGAFRDQAAVGIYSVAHKGSELISAVMMTQISAFASTAANLYVLRDRERLQHLVTRLARWTLLLSAPAIVVMTGFGRWYLLLYGSAFSGARATLAILSAGQAVNVAAGCVGMLLVTTGHERRVARAIGAGAIANVALSFALAPKWGAEGVAVAYAASMALWNVWAAVDLYRLTGIDSTILGRTRISREDEPAPLPQPSATVA